MRPSSASPALLRWLPRRSPATTAVLCVAAAFAVLRALHRVLADPLSGLDFRPLYEAGLAVRDHGPLYDVANFVYPPVAAFVAAPITLLSLRDALAVWTLLATVALVTTCALVVALLRTAGARWDTRSTDATAALVAVLFLARPTLRSLDLGNASLFLPVTAMLVCWWWGAQRWHAGTALLVASLVVKPVLLPLVLVPLLRGRWRPLVVWGLAGAVAMVVALEASAGIGAIPQVVDGLLHATHFTGRDAPLNLSLAGFVTVHPALSPLLRLTQVVAVAIAGGAVVGWMRTGHSLDQTPREQTRALLLVSTALLTTLLLVGSISEVHYLLILLPGVAVAAFSRRALPAALATAAAVAYLSAVSIGRAESTQVLLVAMEVMTLLATAGLLAWPTLLLVTRDQQPLSAAAGASSTGAPDSARFSRARWSAPNAEENERQSKQPPW